MDIKFWVNRGSPFGHFKSVSHCHLASEISEEKYTVFEITFLYVIWQFSLVAFKIFPLL